MIESQEYIFAKSMAGHDKDKIYLIVNQVQDSVYLCDGDLRRLEKLKKKNIKHVQIIKKLPTEVVNCLANETKLKDETIRKAIKLYVGGQNV